MKNTKRKVSIVLKIILIIFAGAILFVLLADTALYVLTDGDRKNLFAIDKCLDKGGRWNKETENCQFHE